MGIEPTWPAWKAEALPLSYARIITVGRAGFEPAKAVPTDLQSVPFGRLGISPNRSELAAGVEPTTCGLQNRCSAIELR